MGEKMKKSANKIKNKRRSDFQHPGTPVFKNFFAFTLVEIIVVIGIMALLMAVAMPAFSSMMKGAGVEGAARNICQTLKLARSFAINNREYVAVLMPQSKKGNGPYPAISSDFPSDFYDRSYRVCLVTYDSGTSTFSFKRWITGEKWEYLPKGTAILECDTDTNADTAGGLLVPNNGTCVLVDSVNCDDIQSGSTSVDDIAAIIFAPSGKVKPLNDYYINIGEGVGDGNSLTVTNTGEESYTTVTINKYTGRITYGSE